MSEEWQKVKELFHAALEHEPVERTAFLIQACAGDEAVRREVESLIAAHEKPGSFVDAPAVREIRERRNSSCRSKTI